MKEEEKEQVDHEKEKVKARTLLDCIIANTYARDNDKSEEEFLERIGYKDSGLTEEQAIIMSKINLYQEITNKIFAINEKIDAQKGIFELLNVEGEK